MTLEKNANKHISPNYNSFNTFLSREISFRVNFMSILVDDNFLIKHECAKLKLAHELSSSELGLEGIVRQGVQK